MNIDKKINRAIKRNNLPIFIEFLALIGHNLEYELYGKGFANNDTLLMRACRHGSISIVKYLIAQKVNINKQTTTTQKFALFLAAQRGHHKIVQSLIDAGANPNQRAINDLTPILLAAQQGNTMAVDVLVRHANPNIIDKDGLSPIGQAVQLGHILIVKLLLDAGANPNLGTNNGMSPLQCAVKNLNHKIMKMLLEAGADYTQPFYIPLQALKMRTVFDRWVRFKQKTKLYLEFLAMAREFRANSVFYRDYLPKDMFNVIVAAVKREIELAIYYQG